MNFITKWAIAAAVILIIPFANHPEAAPSFDYGNASTRVEFKVSLS